MRPQVVPDEVSRACERFDSHHSSPSSPASWTTSAGLFRDVPLSVPVPLIRHHAAGYLADHLPGPLAAAFGLCNQA